MSKNTNDDNNPWRHHPLFEAYNKFYEGKNVSSGRKMGIAMAIVVVLVVILWFVFR